jgi:predicted ATPase
MREREAMTIPRTLLTRVRVEGFRSLKNVTLDLAPINVLIGPNGAGKSNLLSVLRLVPLMRTQNLRYFVGREGGASTLLHHGPATTREIELDLTFASDQGANVYHARLGYSAHDSLIFLDESVRYERPDQEKPLSVSLGAGYGESLLMERARDPEAKTERVLNGLLDRMSFFHFQDTPFTSPLRKNSVAADNRTLRSDGSNLAAVMYRLRTSESPDQRPAWNRIEGLVKRVAPFIGRLEPDLVAPELPNSAIRLYWTDTSGHRFDEHDLSGGTLRAIALVVALAQPASTLPAFISIDEPELGLHPAALSLVASLIRSVSSHSQIVLSTQSSALLDEFETEEVIVVEQTKGESTFRRLDPTALADWLAEYNLSELYDKNVLGGRP